MDKEIGILTENITKNAPLEEARFLEISQSINCRFPSDYIDFMKQYNGGEGVISDGWYVRFWPLEELQEANEDYIVSEFAPKLLLIGSDGGDTAFGIKRQEGVFVEVPFIGLSDDNAIERGVDFKQFLSFLSRF